MTAGTRSVVFNPRERAVSNDLNRLQAFAASDLIEVLRAQYLQPTDDAAFVGTSLDSNPGALGALLGSTGESVDATDTVSTPLQGIVLNGLAVIVPVAATSFLVQPGTCLLADRDGEPGASDPDAPNTDENDVKFVRDPGITNVGQLLWTPNIGPGHRMDLIEVRRQEIDQESDNRDVYDPATSTFTAATVVKVRKSQLEYRVRLGVPAGGLPAVAQGWMPLAVVSTPAGAANLDGCEVWDVRPLASDLDAGRALNPGNRTDWHHRTLVLDTVTAPGELRLSGRMDGVTRGGWRVGGIIRGNDASTAYVDLLSTNHAPTGWSTPAAGSMYRIYAAFPGGLPRWVRYWSAGAVVSLGGVAGRTPGTFRGVLCISTAQDNRGVPLTAITLPEGLGFTDTTTRASLVAVGVTHSIAPNYVGFVEDENGCRLAHEAEGSLPWRVVGNSGVWEFLTSSIRGTAAPLSAKSIKVRCELVTSGLVAGDVDSMRVKAKLCKNPGGTGVYATIWEGDAARLRGSGSTIRPWIEVSIPVGGGDFHLVPERLYFELFDAAALPAMGSELTVVGWSF